VRMLFGVAGIEKILVTFDTVEEAKKALAG
jgi:hypothetical protein